MLESLCERAKRSVKCKTSDVENEGENCGNSNKGLLGNNKAELDGSLSWSGVIEVWEFTGSGFRTIGVVLKSLGRRAHNLLKSEVAFTAV